MPNLKRVILTALAVILVVGATPAAAQLVGTWAGEGTGCCSPNPWIVIYPWQNWKGEIPEDEDVFKGEWWDADGNHGSFFGKPAPFSTPESKIYQGYWTWEPSSGIYKGGEFTMTFYFLEGECKGTWNSIWPSGLPCRMWGKKVD
jgi:hypothetical protein